MFSTLSFYVPVIVLTFFKGKEMSRGRVQDRGGRR
jgi:hypothetical protein